MLATLPVPLPVIFTLRVKISPILLKVAVTPVAALIVTLQVSVPEQPPPDQPLNLEFVPARGAAFSVTSLPSSYSCVQSLRQSMPLGTLVTTPAPEPALLTGSLCFVAAPKVAVTSLAPLIVTWQVPVPEQPLPDQPVNLEPAAALAVSVTSLPASYSWSQSLPQAIPAGELVTEPHPEPAFETVSLASEPPPVTLTKRV